MKISVDLDDRESVIAAANRSAATAIAAHHRAGRSTYSGDVDHTYERLPDGTIYLVENRGRGLERARLVRPPTI